MSLFVYLVRLFNISMYVLFMMLKTKKKTKIIFYREKKTCIMPVKQLNA